MNLIYKYGNIPSITCLKIFTGLIWLLLGISGCNNLPNIPRNQILNLNAIAGKDTSEVIKVLGKPDYKFYDLGGGAKLAYKARNLEIGLKNGKANQFVLRGLSSYPFDKKVLEELGLKVIEPSFVVPNQWLQWENMVGFKVITVFKDSQQGIESIEIIVTD